MIRKLAAVSLIVLGLSSCTLTPTLNTADPFGLQGIVKMLPGGGLQGIMGNVTDPDRLQRAVDYLCNERVKFLPFPATWCNDAETAVGLYKILFGVPK